MNAAKNESVNLPSRFVGDTRETLASDIGVSGKTYEALRTVNTDGAPELIDAVRCCG